MPRRLLGLDPSCFCSPDAAVYCAAGGAAGVQACVKARTGILFPLPAAFCFLEAVSRDGPARGQGEVAWAAPCSAVQGVCSPPLARPPTFPAAGAVCATPRGALRRTAARVGDVAHV